ncbi:hypothetical protein [Streptomyces gardneri]|uniref:hypothetical protein n=2 Tax=Streptomyces gardneri TaxID=66892 RepID=UPI0006BDDE1B|nr:hypothetical protein BN2537_4841 [Streptomyces venezuelae]
MEMRHRPETDTDEPGNPEKAEVGRGADTAGESTPGRRRIDLSVAQVSGSALAAVIAAKLASTLGVYGTILGAGVISVIATCGGPLFQHLFRRTGEQVRDATAAAKPKARQVPLPAARPAGDGDRHTLMLGTVPPPASADSVPYDEEFGAATTHGTRVRGWKRPAIAAALVFGVTMGGITAYELVSGQDFSGTQGTTTFGSVVRGGGSSGQDAPDRDEDRAPTPSGSAGDTGQREDGDGTPATGATPDPDKQGAGTATPDPDPTSSGSDDGGSTPPPNPTPTDPDPTTDPTTGPTDPAGPTEPTTGPTGPTDPVTPTAPTGAPTTGAVDPGAPTAPATGGAG